MRPNPTPEMLAAIDRYHEEIKKECAELEIKIAAKKEKERIEKLQKQKGKR